MPDVSDTPSPPHEVPVAPDEGSVVELTAPAPKPPMLVAAAWDDFANAGLFWWVNRTLHLFGWALVREMDDDGPDAKVMRVYPARCRFRGFSEDVETTGFQRLTAHLRDNVDELVQHTKE